MLENAGITFPSLPESELTFFVETLVGVSYKTTNREKIKF